MPALSPLARRWLGRGPIWVLIAAWFCANSPQTLTYDVVVWVGSARHFTHQQKLTAEVASLLAGERAPQLLTTVSDAPTKPFSPAVSEQAVVKKITLAVVSAFPTFPPILTTQIRPELTCPPLRSALPQTPYEPPRAELIS